MKVQNNIKNLK